MQDIIDTVLLKRVAFQHYYIVMRLYLFVWPKSLLIVNYIIKSLYSMVKINLEYFHFSLYYLLYDDYLRT